MLLIRKCTNNFSSTAASSAVRPIKIALKMMNCFGVSLCWIQIMILLPVNKKEKRNFMPFKNKILNIESGSYFLKIKCYCTQITCTEEFFDNEVKQNYPFL